MSITVAVLFARKDSIYKTIEGCDVWDLERDALKWPGGSPVVAHPPCRLWASLRHKSKADPSEKELALWAIRQVRKYGGVLEHPQQSTLFKTVGISTDPKIRDFLGGFVRIVNQHWWGHRARKATTLYFCGIDPISVPAYPLPMTEPSHTVGLFSGRDRATCKPGISKREFEATPIALAEWLVAIAKLCKPPTQ